jgi:hypothetical protein
MSAILNINGEMRNSCEILFLKPEGRNPREGQVFY